MTLKAGVQMDPIESINIKGDSTFALLLEAQARGHSLFYYTPSELFMRDGLVWATGSDLRVEDVPGAHFMCGPSVTRRLDELDVILLRQDPPFDMAYITTTYLLERLGPRTLVVNDPASVRNSPEKLLVTHFPELMPPTLITSSAAQLKDFRNEHGDVVVKPLYGNGGAAVFRLKRDDTNAGSLVEVFQKMFREPFVVQKYLPDVRRGDKRIILIDGKPVGAINRVPAPDETRSNMHAGGMPEAAELSHRDLEICHAIETTLRDLGLIFAGIDVIGDYLTEINVTSPTGIREIKRFGGADIASSLWQAIGEKCQQR